MKKNWLAILLIAIMSVCIFASCTPTVDTGSGSTGSSTGGGDTTQTEDIAGSGTIAPTFASEGLLKQEGQDDIVLPVLNDTNYAYVEEQGVATFTYPKEGTKVWETKVAYKGSLIIDGTALNNVTAYFKTPQGLNVTYKKGTFILSVDADVTATSIEGDCMRIVGSKTLTLTEQLKSTDTLIVEAGPTVVVNRASGDYAIDVVNAEFQKGSNITATTTGGHTMAIRGGTVLAHGNLNLKETLGADPESGATIVQSRANGKNGIVGFGTCYIKLVRYDSRVVLEGYRNGFYSSNPNKLYVCHHKDCGKFTETSLMHGQDWQKSLFTDNSESKDLLVSMKNCFSRSDADYNTTGYANYANG